MLRSVINCIRWKLKVQTWNFVFGIIHKKNIVKYKCPGFYAFIKDLNGQ